VSKHELMDSLCFQSDVVTWSSFITDD